MPYDQTTMSGCADESSNSDGFVALDCIHTQLRHAVEDRNYVRVQELVLQQRAVFETFGPQHPEAFRHAVAARDLAMWALTMVRLQRAHDQRALLELVAFKKAHESYKPKLVRDFACLAEG